MSGNTPKTRSIELPKPGSRLIKATDDFFKWADGTIRKDRLDQKHFRRWFGVSAPDYTHWKKADWPTEHPITPQLRVSLRLLATLNYEGLHDRFSAKDSDKNVRPGGWTRPSVPVNVPERPEWTVRAHSAVDLLEPYYQQLLTQKLRSKIPGRPDDIISVLKSPELRGDVIDSILERHYGPEYENDLKTPSVKNLFITGTNLRRIVSGEDGKGYLDHVDAVLDRNGTVKILMNHPDNYACKYAMLQDRVAAAPSSNTGISFGRTSLSSASAGKR